MYFYFMNVSLYKIFFYDYFPITLSSMQYISIVSIYKDKDKKLY